MAVLIKIGLFLLAINASIIIIALLVYLRDYINQKDKKIENDEIQDESESDF